ncbi:MAG TPA: undecaprenyl-diphosphate phosphatase [Lachnospiraceae bacterium]|nr:undecaprenyl-diphosphate phosphatase [Lachnospiraceae bacterium]
MGFLQSIFLGAVQGLTEFFPISSSGHLAVCEHLLNIDTNIFLFDVFLHIGTLVAVIAAMQKDVQRLIVETIRILRDIWINLTLFLHSARTQDEPKYVKVISTNYRKFAVLIVVATIPTALIGYLLNGIAQKSFSSLLYTGVGFFLSGIVLIVVDMVKPGNKIPKDVPYWQAVLVGIVQGVSVMPGFSRSGATISAGILCGFNKKLAVRFSFLLSIPAIIGALIFEIAQAKTAGSVDPKLWGYSAAGAVTACIVGFFCIKKMLSIVQQRKLKNFAVYCFFIGCITVSASFLK